MSVRSCARTGGDAALMLGLLLWAKGHIQASGLAVPVRTATSVSRRVLAYRTSPDEHIQLGLAAKAERWAWRASRLVPGAACLHRALAARIWLALHGVDACIVVGIAPDDRSKAHAWLTLPAPPIEVLRAEAEDYVRLFDETAFLNSAKGGM